MTEVTPLRQQYLDVKQKYRDCIVMFRLGDFYEMFDEDAEIAARELDLVLTGRAASKSERVPMAGVPYHAAHGYIAKLLVGLIVLHASAALYHQFVRKDGLLARMSFGRRQDVRRISSGRSGRAGSIANF